MSRLASLCRHFVASTRAVAAIEFAIVMPVLALIFFGTFDAGRAIAIYMKIRSATFAIDASPISTRRFRRPTCNRLPGRQR
jgi:Flp pilus assembly protein TadG